MLAQLDRMPYTAWQVERSNGQPIIRGLASPRTNRAAAVAACRLADSLGHPVILAAEWGRSPSKPLTPPFSHAGGVFQFHEHGTRFAMWVDPGTRPADLAGG